MGSWESKPDPEDYIVGTPNCLKCRQSLINIRSNRLSFVGGRETYVKYRLVGKGAFSKVTSHLNLISWLFMNLLK